MPTRSGTYQNGFAPRDFRPAYPELWRGCVGAWCPSLGPSGVTLMDWSGYQNHGTLTNTTLDTVWAVRTGSWTLLLDGSNDRVATSVSVTAPFTVCGWLYMASLPGANLTKDMLATRSGSTGFNFGLQTFSGNFWFFQILGTTKSISPASPNPAAGTWYHIAGTMTSAGAIEMFVNGASIGTNTGAVMAAGSTVSLGSLPGGGNNLGANLDDQRVYNRVLTRNEIALLASRRGIAYEWRTPARYSVQDAAVPTFSYVVGGGVGGYVIGA